MGLVNKLYTCGIVVVVLFNGVIGVSASKSKSKDVSCAYGPGTLVRVITGKFDVPAICTFCIILNCCVIMGV